MGFLGEFDHLTALGASGGFVLRRVLQFHEVILVSSVPDVHFGLKSFSAFSTLPPIAAVAFHVMVTAEGVAPVVSMATVCRVRENDVLILIVANPLATALCSGQLVFLAAQPTSDYLSS
jgi:hypothetical protein